MFFFSFVFLYSFRALNNLKPSKEFYFENKNYSIYFKNNNKKIQKKKK